MPFFKERLRPLILFCAIMLVWNSFRNQVLDEDAAASVIGDTADVQAHVHCLNELYNFSPADETHIFINVERNVLPTAFRVGQVFSSPSKNVLPLTVVTMATLDRLSALKVQCESWPGPLIAAVYTPFTQRNGKSLNVQNRVELSQISEFLRKFAASITSATSCSLTWSTCGVY